MLDFEDLHELPTPEDECAPEDKQKFICAKCDGTGVWSQRRTNRHGNSDCHTCRGRGFLLTDPAVLLRAREHRQARKVANVRERVAATHAKVVAYRENHSGVVSYVEENSSWSGFFSSLMGSLLQYGEWTPRQLAAAESAMTKGIEAKTKREAEAIEVDLTKLHALFATATASGLRRPALTLDGVRVSLAPVHGANAGHLYVKIGESYQGKVTPEGKFMKVRSAEEGVETTLSGVAADPKGSIRSIGLDTGVCCCCGRALTAKSSLESGIGPVCADKWGIQS